MSQVVAYLTRFKIVCAVSMRPAGQNAATSRSGIAQALCTLSVLELVQDIFKTPRCNTFCRYQLSATLLSLAVFINKALRESTAPGIAC
jgi:hypothetical protein